MAMSAKDACRRYSIAEARDRLAALVHDVETGTRAELTRRGRPVAVVLSFEAYQRLVKRPADDFWSAYARYRESTNLARLEIESVFEDIRDRSPGREPEW